MKIPFNKPDAGGAIRTAPCGCGADSVCGAVNSRNDLVGRWGNSPAKHRFTVAVYGDSGCACAAKVEAESNFFDFGLRCYWFYFRADIIKKSAAKSLYADRNSRRADWTLALRDN